MFNRLAEAYRSRPEYPEALVDRLAELGGGEGAHVADLGAGTGLLALPLASCGLVVSAVEPARAMLKVLAERLELVDSPIGARVVCVHAAAEQTTLPAAAFDLVLVADALQWVDPELTGHEAARLLHPERCCAVVEAALADTPFLRELAELLGDVNPKARAAKAGGARQLISLATSGAPVTEERFVQEAALDDFGLEGVLRSLSYIGPAVAPGAFLELLGKARRLASAHGGALWRRALTLTFARHRL